MQKSNATKNIIVVDDDSSILDSLKFMFRNSTDYKIKYFDNPKTAFKDIIENNYECIITDIEMPEMSGIEMIFDIQKIIKLQKVIFISSNIQGYRDILDKNNFIYLDKPIKKDKLFSLL